MPGEEAGGRAWWDVATVQEAPGRQANLRGWKSQEGPSPRMQREHGHTDPSGPLASTLRGGDFCSWKSPSVWSLATAAVGSSEPKFLGKEPPMS